MSHAQNITSSNAQSLVSSWAVQSAEATALLDSTVGNEQEERAPKKAPKKNGSQKLYSSRSPTLDKNSAVMSKKASAAKASSANAFGPSDALIDQYTSDIEALLDALGNETTSSSDLASLLNKIKGDLTAILTQGGLGASDAAAKVSALTANSTFLSSGKLPQVLADFSNLLKALSSDFSDEKKQKILGQTIKDMSSCIKRMKEADSSTKSSVLASVTPPSTEPSADSNVPGVNKLIAYFMAIMLIQVSLSADQSKLNGEVNSMTSSLVTVCQGLAKKAADDLAKYLAAVEAEKHQSWFEKLFSTIAAVCMFVVGAVTGQPALCMMGALMLIMQVSGGQDALNNALSSLPGWGKILCEFAIAVVEAVVTGGITGAMEGGAAATSEEAGASAVEEAGGSAGGQAIEMTDFSVQASSETVEESSSILSKISKYLTGGTFKGGNFISQLSKTLVMGSFWQDTFYQLAKGCGASEKDAEIVGTVVGMVVGLATAFGTSYLESSGNPAFSLKDFMTKQVGNDGFNAIKSTLKGATFAMNVSSGAYAIKQAKTIDEESDIQKDQATTYKSLAIYQGVIDVLNTVFTELSKGFATVQSEMGDIMQSGNKFLTPYNPNSYSA